MKKIIIVSLLVIMAASSSFAGDTAISLSSTSLATSNIVANDTNGAAIGRLSSNDGLGWGMTTSGYTILTQHLQGTRSYGTAHDGTAIYWTPETKGSAHNGAPTVGVSYFATGWTVM